VIAMIQIRQDTPGRIYYLRKRSDDKSYRGGDTLLETTPLRHHLPPARPRR
jgi:hypothetical protein